MHGQQNVNKSGWDGLDWIYLAQDNDQRQDVVRMVTGFVLPLIALNISDG